MTDLAALSAAATPGTWATESEGGDEWYFGNSRDGMETVVRVDDGLALIVSGCADNPDLVFATALVNAYRSGNLVQIDREGVRKRVVDAIASCLGDEYDMVPKNKMEWVKARGMCGGFPRDINAPFQCDYDAAADAAIAAILGGEHDK